MSDNIHVVWGKFFDNRTRVLWDRFPGYYRAVVVETNDPLNMMRVRFKCPDMHDFDLKPEDCPWAVPAFDLGGSRAGRFANACIGDWIWITFEKQHPYAPIWVGFATPTRRKYYTYPQIFQISPVSLNDKGDAADAPNDYDEKYLPKDGRPMAHGWQDRYGNLDISSSVGFFPKSHDIDPPPADHDAVQGSSFKIARSVPIANKPDKKYMVRMTKYGHMLVMGDQGYDWRGEFSGDPSADEEYETKRWKYIQKLINEDKPDSTEPDGDQRRITLSTRYGHKIECRDVGWAQAGPQPSRTRMSEYGQEATLSKERENDFRWIKIRTKGGMLFQAYDKGFDPQEDNFVKRSLLDEVGSKTEKEDEYWKDKDARWMRLVTRHGFKIVLDDRGSDTKAAEEKESPRGNGILIKGRRSPGANAEATEGDPRGYYWEFNENDKANHTIWGSPLGRIVEMNDRYQYTMIASSLGKDWSAVWKGIEENEFIRKPSVIRDPESNSHHLKIDHANEYIRLKTRAGRGQAPENPINSPVGIGGINQGLEARDGSKGDGAWVEVVDSNNRGMWWSQKYAVGAWRSNGNTNMYMWMDETKKQIVIWNDEVNGKTVIYSKGNIELLSDENVEIKAGKNIILYAESKIKTKPSPEGGAEKPQGTSLFTPLFPRDRGFVYNKPYEECPIDEVEHKL